ncbi:MAG: DUF11 domain-containing protein, partial [Acidobacteria bacterium]|nr:DUF11 domain-containing protein [Acidobacteriota bacterium]
MRVCKTFVRALVCLAAASGMFGGVAKAQVTVTVSPTDLSFGVPTGTSPAASAPQTVTVNIKGQGAVTFSGASTTNSDFTVNGNSCTGTLTAPTTCQVSVVFKASLAPATTLETATLSIASNATPGVLAVPMNGAFGAVALFTNSVDVATSSPSASFDNLVNFGTQSLNLSCPAGATATISSSPDGAGNVVVDNYLILNSGPTPTSQMPFGNGAPAGNVCTGGVSDSNQQDCFTQAYRDAAGNFGANGQDPDSFASTWGVAPIDVSSAFNGNVTATFNLLDAGVVLTSSRLFLVSKCSLAGVVPGGSITGNPINNNNPSSQTQTFTFDNGGGQNIGFTTSTSTAQQKGTVNIPSGTVPIITDIGIPQNLFSQLVAGTSAAPAVCLRLTGETDASGAAMCKGYLMQCQDPNNQTISGDNCVPTPSTARNLLDIARFESPDAPANGTNFLGTACDIPIGSNCASTNLAGPTPVLIGPGMLLGSDNWLCTPGANLTTCANQELDTHTTNTGANYAAANCVLTGSLTGDLCPLDTLTEFLGAADPTHGSTTSGKNSIFVPVVNMPLPNTAITTTPTINGNGWVNNTAVTVNFTSNPANYTAATPSPNGFIQAPTYSLTYGVTPASSPIPDTTYPVTGDATNWNPTANANFGKPFCTSRTTPSFASMAALVETPGVYNLHYFTTDCALTEELLFNPQGTQLTDPTANWASFRTLAFGVDNSAPVLAACTLNPSMPNGSHGWFTTSVTASCNATDDLSGFAPGTAVLNTNGAVLQGPLAATLTPSSTGSGAAAQIPAQSIQDLAGNTSNTVGPYPTPIDNTAPTFSAAFSVSGTSFTVGQNVKATFTCADTGSGVAICGTQTVSACAGTPGMGLGSFNTPVAIDTSVAAVGSHTVNAVDCAGNPSATSVTYTVAFGSAELAIANLPTPLSSVKSGNNLTYKIFVLNFGPNTANNVVVTNPLPANTTFVSAMSGIVSCSAGGCNDLTTGSACVLNANVVTCTTPTVKPLFPGLTGFVIKLVVKVTAPASVKSVTDTATVSASNPDPNKAD